MKSPTSHRRALLKHGTKGGLQLNVAGSHLCAAAVSAAAPFISRISVMIASRKIAVQRRETSERLEWQLSAQPKRVTSELKQD